MSSTDTADPARTTDPLLVTDALTKYFGELVAVDGVNLAVERGEFRSVIGPNGAGKTTLFDLVTGALSPSSGTVSLDGADITGLAPNERARRGIGRSFQITTVFEGLTVRENVRLAAQAVHHDSLLLRERLFHPSTEFAAINATTAEVLDDVGLAGRAELPAGALSYGERRRLEIGLVLATDPSLVLLDEPMAGMSADETRATLSLIDDVLADRTLLLIEHDINLVLSVSDRITVLHRGQELATDTPEAIAADETVQQAYLGGVNE